MNRRNRSEYKRYLSTLFLGLVVLAIGGPGISTAGASTLEGINSIEILAEPGEQNRVTVTESGINFVVTDTAGITDDSHQLLSCTQLTPEQVACPQVEFINAELGDLDDTVHLVDLPPASVKLLGGSGNDLLDASGVEDGGSSSMDLLEGDAGSDTMIGTPGGSFFDSTCQPDVPCDHPESDFGDDHMTGGPNGDVMYGGAGRDVMDSGGGPDVLRGIVEKLIPGLTGGYPADDRAIDTVDCGSGQDLSYLGVGDKVTLDCEEIQQFTLCPARIAEGTRCEGEPKVLAKAAATRNASASAARKKKPKPVVLATGGKVVLKPGGRSGVYFTLNKRKARRTLGKRAAMNATFKLGLDRIRRGKKLGTTKRNVPFRLKR